MSKPNTVRKIHSNMKMIASVMEFDLLKKSKTTAPYLDLYRRWKSRKHNQNSTNTCIIYRCCVTTISVSAV